MELYECTLCGEQTQSAKPYPPCPRGCRLPHERPNPRGTYEPTALVEAPPEEEPEQEQSEPAERPTEPEKAQEPVRDPEPSKEPEQEKPKARQQQAAKGKDDPKY